MSYIFKPGTSISDTIPLGTTGLTDGSFTKVLYQDGAVSGDALDTITEIGSSGVYKISFTPSSTGNFQYQVYVTTESNVRYVEYFNVRNDIAEAVDDQVIEVNGSITRQQAESLVLAAVAGRTSGGGLTFKDPSNTSNRIVGVVDGSDNRTSITLTPSS